MNRPSLVPATLFALSCLLGATQAKADTFLLTATAPKTSTNTAVDLTATLTGTADTGVMGAFDITAGTGTFNGTPITLYTTGAIPAGSFQTANFTSPPFASSSSYEFDNVVYTSGNAGLALDPYGLLFSVLDPTTGQPTDHLNPYSQGSNYVYTNDETLFGFNAPLYTLTLTDLGPTSVTPEPTSIALLGTGLLGVAGVLRRRRA